MKTRHDAMYIANEGCNGLDRAKRVEVSARRTQAGEINTIELNDNDIDNFERQCQQRYACPWMLSNPKSNPS